MADSPDVPRNLFSIVIIGRFNPTIQHPIWYRHLNLLDEQETDAALKTAPFLASQPASQFVSPAFAVLCSMDRWEIQTPRSEYMDRILSTACTVWEALTHTQLAAYGFNYHFHLDVPGVEDVGGTLARTLTHLPFDFRAGENPSAEIAITSNPANRKYTASALASPLGRNIVWVRANSHYEITGQPPGKNFDLTPMLREHFWPDYEAAKRQADSIVVGLRKLTGGNRGTDS